MSNPNISASLTPAQLATIQTNAAGILVILVFLANLTPDQRRKLRKMATKRTGYVNDVFTAVSNNASAMPASYDVPEFQKDMNLMTALKQIRAWLAPIVEGIDDTILLLSSELMQQSDRGYALLKEAAKGNAALTTVVEQIATAFQRQSAAMQVVSIPANGSVTINKVDTGRSIVNTGNTVLKVGKFGEDASTYKVVNPQDALKLQTDFKKIVVQNQSATSPGEITFKLKP